MQAEFENTGVLRLAWGRALPRTEAYAVMDSLASNPSQRPLVAVVEDEASVRALFRHLLTALPVDVQEFGDQRSFLAAAATRAFCCAIIDFHLPDGDGLDILRQLQTQQLPTVPVLVSGQATVEIAVQALRYGAVDVLEKPVAPEVFQRVVRAAIGQGVERVAAWQQVQQIRQRLARLTASERAVLDLVVRGETNKRIAGLLNLGLRTIEARKNALYRKLRVNSVAEIVRLMHAVSPAAPSSPAAPPEPPPGA